MPKYCIGLDFGTLSGRALLVNIENGEEIAIATYNYSNGVMDKKLLSGKPLPPNWALQNPIDYIEAIYNLIPELLKKSGINKNDIIGIGVDSTACTLIPVKNDGTPLCIYSEFADEPHAYVKLWKHHAAQKYADEINKLARKQNEKWLKLYGGITSSEWLFAKILQIYDEARNVYDETDIFVEAGDWIVWQLTGNLTKSFSIAGYKAMWINKNGYVSEKFLEKLRKGFSRTLREKLKGKFSSIGTKAGYLTKSQSLLCGLNEGIPIAVALIDAHSAFISSGINKNGTMMAIIGTSSCQLLISEKLKYVPGICGVVKDGIIPNFYGYEAGQAAVGDCFSWFVENCVPKSYFGMASLSNMNIHQFLISLSEKQKPGQSGLIILDWLNGNRSILNNSDLSGLIIGITLQTKPEDLYRALIEATAYGLKRIIDNFEENGIIIETICASGGIANKNYLLMQIYSDVINRKIFITNSSNSSALGAAIFGAVAASKSAGGYDNIIDASLKMGKIKSQIYIPNPENVNIYKSLYVEYLQLHDYFGKNQCVMKKLKAFY